MLFHLENLSEDLAMDYFSCAETAVGERECSYQGEDGIGCGDASINAQVKLQIFRRWLRMVTTAARKKEIEFF